jgi:hypothetical protein
VPVSDTRISVSSVSRVHVSGDLGAKSFLVVKGLSLEEYSKGFG